QGKKESSDKSFNGFVGRDSLKKFSAPKGFPNEISKGIIGPDQHKNPDQNRGIIPMGRVLIGNQGQKHQGGNHIKNDHHVFAPLEKGDFPNDHQVSDQQDIDDQGRKHQQQG